MRVSRREGVARLHTNHKYRQTGHIHAKWRTQREGDAVATWELLCVMERLPHE